MKYIESLTDFFKQPNYVKNLLLAGLCACIPFVGPIAVGGWLALGFWGRKDQNPATFPDFDFGKFVFYLQRGLWPFLVTLVVGMVVWIVVMILMSILGVILGLVAGKSGILASLIGFVFFLVYLATIVGILLVTKPLAIRALLAQDFAKAFDVAFAKLFLTKVGKEAVISALFIAAVGLILSSIGTLALCVGIIPAIALTLFAAENLNKQLYDLYLTRGGTPLEMSPLLTDSAPPPMVPPAAPPL